ncbi:protein of unknown function [Halopseudomonas xinjiangensis]|uniref:DUF4124 domain-containing protein n=1 Tax=Halopseudomonas xinjiangensis TaxID=487184 RepID=A0A1H1X2N1_9GAMM|nr:DUF4124 domain-containing protein [Halopseudomonas xinjiangensis]SDT03578.1 protein of unknown function [Halopseudomonas xinjiangensis]
MLCTTRVAVLSLISALLALPVQAEVYTWTDAQGNRHYSDQQPADGQGKTVEVPKVNTIEPPPDRPDLDRSSSDSGNSGSGSQQASYRRLAITSPSTDEPVRANDGSVMLTVETDPPLSSNHLLRVEMDGEPTDVSTPGIGQSTYQLVLPNVDRGSHAVSVAVVNARGETLQRSEPVLLHVQRTSLNQPGRGGANQAPTAPAAPRAPNVPAPRASGT